MAPCCVSGPWHERGLPRETAYTRPCGDSRRRESSPRHESVAQECRTPPSRRKCGDGAVPLRFFLGCFRNEFAHFRDGNRRKNTHEQEEEHDKESDGAGEGGPIPEGWLVAAPGRRCEIACEADDHDDEALEPHAGVDDEGHDEKKRDVVAQLVKIGRA